MRSSALAIFLSGLILLGIPGVGSAGDGSPPELLKPADQKKDAADHTPRITYKLSNGSDKWDASARDRITKAMDEAVAVYNKNGEFDRVLTANWSPGTPTADANFGGWINFGGQIGTRTALHEIAHTLGIGTAPKWKEFSVNGKWIGKYGIEQLREIDGPDAVLHCDRQHFWPYGLNYENEGGAENFKRNVLMVTAMRADMGLGPPPHPAARALKQAKEDAAAAHAAVDKLQTDLKIVQNKTRTRLDTQPTVVAASDEVRKAKEALATASASALQSLHQTAEYKAAEENAVIAQKNLDVLSADTNADAQARADAASNVLTTKSVLKQLETKALSSDARVVEMLRQTIATAGKLDAARDTAYKTDPQLLAAKQALSAAQLSAMTADQAVAKAETAAAREAK